MLGCMQVMAEGVALSVFGSLPSLEQVVLSPDGTKLAFVSTDANDTRFVAVSSLTDPRKALLGGVRVGQAKLREIQWADNDHLMIITSATSLPMGLIGHESEWFMLQVYDLKTQKLKPLLEHGDPMTDDRFMNTINGEPMVRRVDGHTTLFLQGLFVGQDVLQAALFRVDLEAGSTRLVRKGGPTTEWLVDETGQIAAQSDYFEKDHRWVLKIQQKGHLREVTESHDPIDVPYIMGFGPTSDTVMLHTRENDETGWRMVALQDGTISRPAEEIDQFSGRMEDPLSQQMIGGTKKGDVPSYTFLDPAVQKRWSAILRAFPDEHVRFESASADYQKFVVSVQGPKSGYAYVFVDIAARKADPVGDIYRTLTEVQIAKRVTYKAGDGLEIPAYLTLPPKKEPRGLPLVVLVHGGPAAQDTAEFDWWSQALASQGYAVLQPNYRGSTVNDEFLKAGYGQFGRKMQTDVSDGVRYLVKEGIADASRVCIVGASYGGYAALAGATLETGVYRCAVSVAGISDLRRMLEWTDEFAKYDRRAVRYWDRFMGVTGPKDPLLETISPIKHIDVVNIPILLIHGKDDTVVQYSQSKVMYDALQKAGKPVELVTLKHEDHWLSSSATRRQMLESSVAFLRKHNPPD